MRIKFVFFLFYCTISFHSLCSAPINCPLPAAPILYAPSLNDITSNSVSLTWSGNLVGWSIAIELRETGSTAGWVISDTQFVGSTSAIVNNLASGKQYDFRIAAERWCVIDGQDDVLQTITSGIIQVLTKPQAPTLGIANSANSTTITCVWNIPVGSVSGFYLDISTSSLFSEYTFQNINLSSSTASYTTPENSLLPGTIYYYRIRAYNNSGTSSYSSVSSAIPTRPSAPTASQASGITPTSFIVNWNAPIGIVTSYLVDVSAFSDFSNLIISDASVSGVTFLEVTGLNSASNYYYRVRAVNNSGESTYSAIVQSVLTIPGVPSLKSSFSSTSTTITFQWNLPSGVISGFLLDISSNSTFSNFIYKDINLSASMTSYTTPDNSLFPGTNYYYRIRAYNSSGASLYSVGDNVISTRPSAPVTLQASDITSTSFIANWNAPSGLVTSYLIDVSTLSDFSSFIIFNRSVIGATSSDVTGLNSGTSYYYRVRAVNASGESTLSTPVQTVLTVPEAPSLSSAFSENSTSTGFTWSQVPGVVNGYYLDISTNDAFSTFVIQDLELSSTQTSFITTGIVILSPGTAYYCRLRAFNNSGTSDYSIISGPTPTRPEVPIHLDATEKRSTAFRANWNAVSGIISSYQVDVSVDKTFSTFVYKDITTELPYLEVSNLSAGTKYFYRVRAVNVSGVSSNSAAPVEVITAPATPQLFDKYNVSSTGCTVSWTVVSTATQYDIFVYTNSSFTEALPAYNPITINHPTSSASISNLTPESIYYLRLRARNAEDAPNSGSDYINLILNTTSSAVGNPPNIKSVIYPTSHISGTENEISTTLSGGVGSITLELFHRKNSDDSFEKNTMYLSGGAYRITIDDGWFDDFGMEFYIQAKDDNQTVVDIKRSILKSINHVNIPILSFGKRIENYHIISVPYSLDNNLIQEVFGKIMGSYDKKKWRLSHYNNGTLVDYEDGLAFTNLTQGKGYWFISKDAKELNLGTGISFGNNSQVPFKLPLTKGWNQIGNPFPYDISWQDVLEFNETVTGVSSLYIYNPATSDQPISQFLEADKLPVFGGGFIYADEPVELVFPVTLPKIEGETNSNEIAKDVISNGWTLTINLEQNGVVNSFSGVGMSEGAKVGKDKHDKMTPPGFFKYPQLSTIDSKMNEISFDVVPDQGEYSWAYNLLSDDPSEVRLSWNQENAKKLNGQLLLYDKGSKILINMKNRSQYIGHPDAELIVHYLEGSEDIFNSDYLEFGTAYPNPFSDSVTIPLDYLGSQYASIQVIIYDQIGRVFYQDNFEKSIKRGELLTFSWSGENNRGDLVDSGVYIYKIAVQTNDKYFQFLGRVVKN